MNEFTVEVIFKATRKSDGQVTLQSTVLQGAMNEKDMLEQEVELGKYFLAKADARLLGLK